MKQGEKGRLRHKLANLSGLRGQLTDQDEILKGLQPRSQSWEGAPESVMKVIRCLFRELGDALPEKRISFDDSNDIDGLRSQISSVRSKVESDIAAIYEAIGERPPETELRRADEATDIRPSESTDKRRVFVVHGRNNKTRDAMFAFLRAIDLDPIEWEEAIHMTGGTAPYIGNVLDIAFSKVQAAVVLITGDDMACLGDQFVEAHDPAHEKQPTPQARPNVIFEMGMAFGKYPDRTLIVEFGQTRPFSDVTGRNTIRFSDTPQSRKKIADRLRNAGCLVRTDDKSDWLTGGDFSSAFQPPLYTPKTLGAAQDTVDTLKAEIQERNEEITILRRDCGQREKEHILQIAELELRIATGQLRLPQATERKRSARDEARYEKAKAVIEQYGEPARIVIRHLQNVERFKIGNFYDDPPPKGVRGQEMRDILAKLLEEELLAVAVIEGRDPSRTFRIAPGMVAAIDELV